MNDLIEKAVAWYNNLTAARKKVFLWVLGTVVFACIAKTLFHLVVLAIIIAVIGGAIAGAFHLYDRLTDKSTSSTTGQ